MSFFDRFFPVLGSQFGLGALGIFQGLIATQILSHHVDDFTLVAAFFLFAVGCLNMLLGLIFRQGAKVKRSIRGWREEKKGVLPTTKAIGSPTSLPSYPSFNEKAGYAYGMDRNGSVSSYDSTAKVGMGFGRQAEKAAGLRGKLQIPMKWGTDRLQSVYEQASCSKNPKSACHDTSPHLHRLRRGA